jgi:Secretion system C-terminal sorting domain
MKLRYFFFVFLLYCSPIHLSAQTEFAPIGAVWYYNIAVDLDASQPYLLDYFTLTCTGDSLVNGLTMRKVGDYLLYQEDDKVYFWYGNSLNLLYDFGAEPGETITFRHFAYCTDSIVEDAQYILIKIDTVTINGEALRRFAFDFDLTYIEKLGCTNKMIPDPTCTTIPSFRPEWLRCYTINDTIYHSPYFQLFNQDDCAYRESSSTDEKNIAVSLSIYPNPSSDYCTIAGLTAAEMERMEVFNTLGQRVYDMELPQSNTFDIGQCPPGLYQVKVTLKNKQYAMVSLSKL